MNLRPPWLSADDRRRRRPPPRRVPSAIRTSAPVSRAARKPAAKASPAPVVSTTSRFGRLLTGKRRSLWARRAATPGSRTPLMSIGLFPACFDSPAAPAFQRFCAGRAALDHDDRIVFRKPLTLGFWIGRAGENRSFLFIGEQDCRALRPGEEIVGADLAQELRRGRIDADGLVLGAPHDVENRRARGGGKKRIAGETDVRGVGDLARRRCRSLRALR